MRDWNMEDCIGYVSIDDIPEEEDVEEEEEEEE